MSDRVRWYFRLRPRTDGELQAQVDEEIEMHIELRAAELERQGMSAAAARAEAELRFGDLDRTRAALHRAAEEREHRMSVGELTAGWWQDVVYSARALSREPLLAVMIVVTLALGIGANATIFGIVDQLLLRGPAHVESPDELRRVYITEPAYDGSISTSSTTGFITSSIMAELPEVFEDVAVYRYGELRVGEGENSRPERGAWATAGLFTLLGVQPALGRFFTAEEDRPGDPRDVVVLEHGYWQSAFGGSTAVLGESLLLGGREYTVVGVAPPGFTGPELTPARFWVPFSTGFKPRSDWATTWNARWVQVLTRLRPEVPSEQAEARATARYRSAAEEAGRPSPETMHVQLLPPSYTVAGLEPPEVAVSRWLAGVSMIVLLIGCANVVNLLLARGVRRRREVAVRLTLGVSRWRLTRLLLSESLLLAAAGGVLALALAAWGGSMLRAVLLPDVLWDAPLNSRVLVFSAVIVLLTGLMVGIGPALQSLRHDVSDMLRSGARQGGLAPSPVRGALTVAQTALALVLLVGASHFVRSLDNVRALDLGISADSVLGVWAVFRDASELPEADRLAQKEREDSFARDAVQQLRRRGDVAAAALAAGTPLQASMTITLRTPDRDSLPVLPGGGPYVTGVTDGYFETVGTRIVAGRAITEADLTSKAAVVVVNESMAAALWPGRDALGECLLIGGGDPPCYRVIGVAEDARRMQLVEEPAMQYYVPLGMGGISGGQILVRPRGGANAFAAELRAALHTMEPRLNYVTIDPLSKRLDPQMRPWRLGATMFLVFGCLAVIIAAVGLYSVVAYTVAQRRSELGVRIALGASSRNLIALVLGQGLGMVVIGLAIGLPLALIGGSYMEDLLFETSTSEPSALAAVALFLVAVAGLASIVPAWRATRTDPADALRAE